jgi:hypothetical protein
MVGIGRRDVVEEIVSRTFALTSSPPTYPLSLIAAVHMAESDTSISTYESDRSLNESLGTKTL